MAIPFENISTQKRPKSPKVTEMTPFQTPGQKRERKWPSGTPTMQWLIELQTRVIFRDTAHVEAHSLKLYDSRRAMTCKLSEHSSSHITSIASSTALDTGLSTELAALLQETSPLAPYKKERSANRKVIQTFNIMRWTSVRTLQGICEQLEQHFMTFHQNWLLSRPQQWLFQQIHQNWLLSRPRYWPIRQSYSKHIEID